jgi:hypothetical protein
MAGIEIQQRTSKHLKVADKRVNPQGPGLAELLDYLTTLQAHGVPDGASVQVNEGFVQATWIEKRG